MELADIRIDELRDLRLQLRQPTLRTAASSAGQLTFDPHRVLPTKLGADVTSVFAVPLTESRLTPPHARPDWIQRTELWPRLDGSPDTRLVLIDAPRGYGKSSLVTQWIAQRELATAWLTLTRSESRPDALLSSLCAAITRGLSRNFKIRTETPIFSASSDTGGGTQHLFRALSLAPTPLTFVIDDYQTIANPSTNSLINLLVAYLPAPHRLVIISSGATDLALARMRSTGSVVELGTRELKLVPEQARTFLASARAPHMTPQQIDALVDICDGWLAGLRLVLQPPNRDGRELNSITDGPCQAHIASYFTEELFANLDSRLRWFLLRTSILDRFTAELCDAVAQCRNARETIAELARLGVYLDGPDSTGWYHYHPLFRQFLRTRLRELCGDDAIAASHQRASGWLELRGQREAAAHHAVAGRDWDRAVVFIEGIAGELWQAGRLNSARDWIERLPSTVVANHAELSYWLSGGLTLAGRIPDACAALSRADEDWTASGQLDRLAAAREMRSLQALMQDDGPATISAAQEALDLLPHLALTERFRATVLLGAGMSRIGHVDRAEHTLADARAMLEGASQGWIELEELESAWLLLERGRFSEASTIFTHLTFRSDESGRDSAIRAHLGLARIELERDLLPSAANHVRQAAQLIALAGESRNTALMQLLSAQVAEAECDNEGALAAKSAAMEHATAMGNRYLTRQVRALEARCWIDRGEYPLVRRWADESGLMASLPTDHSRAFELLTLLQALLAQGRGLDTLVAAERVQRSADEAGLESTAAAFRTLQALVLFEQGAAVQAANLMVPALQWAERECSVRMVTHYGQRIVPLLQFVSSSCDSDSYSSYLAGEASRVSLVLATGPGGDARLTPRELEVLRLVSTGKSNRGIGDRLFISEGTVKKHLASILTKLRAANRTEAVANARRAGTI